MAQTQKIRHSHANGRQQLRKQRAKPVAETLRQWFIRQRSQVPDGSATAKAIEYSQRAAAISLIQSAKLNGHDPYR
jgi:Transposase IS66 family